VRRGRGEDSLCKDNGLLETNRNHEEGQTLGQENHINRDAEPIGNGQSKEESKARFEKDGRGQPKIRSKASHGKEKRNEGEVHGQVAQCHDYDIEGLGVLKQVKERRPRILRPANQASRPIVIALHSLHDPFLLLPDTIDT